MVWSKSVNIYGKRIVGRCGKFMGRRIYGKNMVKLWGNLWFIDGTLRKHAHGKINRNNIAGGFPAVSVWRCLYCNCKKIRRCRIFEVEVIGLGRSWPSHMPYCSYVSCLLEEKTLQLEDSESLSPAGSATAVWISRWIIWSYWAQVVCERMEHAPQSHM